MISATLGADTGAAYPGGTPPLAVYVHLPWCARKCPYCDFNSHAVQGQLPEAAYLRALLADLRNSAAAVENREVASVFFGGGTPSLFSGAAIAQVLAAIADHYRLAADAEITLEANPGSADQQRFAAYREAGVNRLSIGVQSFNAAQLRALGRIHGPAEARAAIEAASAAGIQRVNVDLMYGLPQQSPAQALTDIRTAINLGPSHISHYQLTIEPNTLFHHRPPTLPGDDACWEMQQRCQRALAEAGLRQYEISAYAQVGVECRHNLNYWRFGDYLGIGAGAHGKLGDPAGRGLRRTAKTRDPRAYTRQAGTPEAEQSWTVSGADAAFEFMLNSLRLTEGFTEPAFEHRTGVAVAAIERPLREAALLGLLRQEPERRWRPTPRGHRFLNDLQAIFLPDPPAPSREGQRRARSAGATDLP